MIISTSAVGMAAQSSKRVTYQQKKQFAMSYKAAYSGASMAKQDVEPENLNYSPAVAVRTEEQKNLQELLSQLRAFLMEFRNRLTLMIGRHGRLGDRVNSVDLSTNKRETTVWNVMEYSSVTYHEKEEMSFQTTGKVVTADGRSIDFAMQVGMSREFIQTTECLTKETQTIYTDPLVINLDTAPTWVSDQKWLFDIDGDGCEEGISMLSKGSGFLAYDKNEDGVIGNGLELFGARTGNGFAELMEHDEDANGWIDEKDSIYDKLSVWIKNDEGEDKLVGLKAANVGAIYLANKRTEFSLMTEDNQSQNAQVRRTGMYLTEDGQARSIQQLDMVKALIS